MRIPKAEEQHSSYTGLIVFLCLCQATLSLDFGMAGVIIPRIGTEFGVASSALAGMVSAYALVYASLLMTGGRLADTFGRRRCCAVGLVCFLAGTVMVMASTRFSMLLGARALQGLGAAFLAPASFSLMNTAVPEGTPRRRAYSILGAAQGIAMAAGPLLGGLLAARFGWRWSYLIDILLAGGLLATLGRIVPEMRGGEGQTRFDYAGAGLIATIIVGFVVAVAGLPGVTITAFQRLGIAAIDIGLLFILAMVERRAASALLPPALFRRAGAMTAPIGMAATMAAATALFLLPNLTMQGLFGWSAAASGFGMLPQAGGAILTGQTTSLLLRRYTLWQNITIGFCGLITALLLFAILLAHKSYLLSIGIPMFLGGWASLFCLLSLLAAGASAVRSEDQGAMSALLFTSQQIGLAAGSAIVLSTAAPGADGQLLSPMRNGYLVASAIAVAGLLVAVPLGRYLVARKEQRNSTLEG